MKVNNRNSAIELLRILAMMGIIGLHYLNQNMGGAIAYVDKGSVNQYLVYGFESILIVSVNVFMLITGYYSISNNKIKLSKMVELYLIMVIYGFIFLIVGYLVGETAITGKNITDVVFPFFVGRRWFVETYILLMLFSPYINIIISKITERHYIILLAIQIVVFSVWPSFFANSPTSDAGYGLSNFITLYLIAGYISKYVNIERLNSINMRIKLIVLFLFCVICSMLGLRYLSKGWNYDFLFNIIGSVSIFLLFLSFTIKPRVFINQIAGTTFGVFLIHSDFSLWNFIYQRALKCNIFYNSKFFVIHMIISISLLFVVSAIIDILRQLVWKKTIGRVIAQIKDITLE